MMKYVQMTNISQKLKLERAGNIWEKEKMLVTDIFSFSHKLFRSLLSMGRKIQGLFGKG